MRGEHATLWQVAPIGSGSSPHARGARQRALRQRGRAGIIPACAGSTYTCRHRRARKWDHPRMRGEHILALLVMHKIRGSSPHARGALLPQAIMCSLSGIIPACAGSTAGVSTSASKSRDHPRMRGEHWCRCSIHGARLGSSPHARGAHGYRHRPSQWSRIIPACAGSTDAPAAE